jgi:tetratricopeptide (TPR) repeat protein
MCDLNCTTKRYDRSMRQRRIFSESCLTNSAMRYFRKISFFLYLLILFGFSQFTSDSLPYSDRYLSISPLGREYCPYGFFWLASLVHWGMNDVEIAMVNQQIDKANHINFRVRFIAYAVTLLLFYFNKYGFPLFIAATLAAFVIAWDIKSWMEKPAKTERRLSLHLRDEIGRCLKAKQYDTALSLVKQAQSIDPTETLSYFYAGLVFSRLRDHLEALSSYEQAARLDKKEALYQVGRGIALTALKRYGEALIAYDQALGIDSQLGGSYNNYAAWEGKSQALRRLGRKQEAKEALQKATQSLEIWKKSVHGK